MAPNVTAVVNLHDEGTSAIPSIISAWRSVEAARSNGVSTELVLLLDRPDDATQRVAASWANRGARIVVADVGDLGAARNAAVDASTAQWIAFLDGDDLWGEDWLYRVHSHASLAAPNEIAAWHPAVNVIFGDHHSLLHHISSEDPRFSWARFRLHNGWTALSFVARQTLVEMPFPQNELDRGFGFEDWSWNAELLRRGGHHYVVPDSCHFIRRTKNESLLSKSRRALRTPYASDDGVAHVERSSLPGATKLLSTITERSPDLPFTHSLSDVDLSDQVIQQIRQALTIEPAIGETITPPIHGRRLPQNTNCHVGAEQLALESLDLLLQSEQHFESVAAACAASEEFLAVDDEGQARIVAELLLDPDLTSMSRGDSALLESAVEFYPQLLDY